MRVSGCTEEEAFSLQHRRQKEEGHSKSFVSMQGHLLMLLTSYIGIRTSGNIVSCVIVCKVFWISHLSSTSFSATNKTNECNETAGQSIGDCEFATCTTERMPSVQSGMTALHLAALNGDKATVHLLLRRHASVHATDEVQT